jgi:hypothetical protein
MNPRPISTRKIVGFYKIAKNYKVALKSYQQKTFPAR